MVASLMVALLATSAAAWAQETTVDGFAYSGDGVDVTNVEADIELGEVVLVIDSADGGTLTITLDSAVLGLVDGEFTAVVDAQAVEFTTTATDTMVEIVIDIPAGGTMMVLSGLEDATVVATSPDPAEEPVMEETAEPVEAAAEGPVMEETAEEEMMETAEPVETEAEATMVEETMEEPMMEETAEEETMMEATAEPVATEVDTMMETTEEETMMEETMAETPTVADFVESGVDIAVYVDRYLNDAGFSSWYDEWYPTTAFHESLGITQAEYQAIVDDLGMVDCPLGTELVDEQCMSICGPGTILEDGMCVPDGRAASASASDADGFKAQGEGLQLGVAAAAGFGGAVGVVLLLWLPSRVKKRWANKQRTEE